MILTFLSPLMLAGALLVAVPVILHLVMRQQPKHMVFPALRFIQQRNDVNKRRLRLRHLLLLALRCAAILFFALAVARPSLQSAGLLADQEAPVAAAMVFDTSPRMQYRHQNQTRLEEAQQAALRILTQLPAGSDVAVINSRRLAPSFSIDMAVARQRIERLTITAAAQPLTEECEDALRLVGGSDKGRKEIYVFTDLTSAAWPTQEAERLRQQLQRNSDVALYVVDVGAEQPQNWSLGNLRLSSDMLAKNSTLRIETDLAGSGPAQQRTVSVDIIDAMGHPQPRAKRVVETEAGRPQPTEFQIAGLEEGVHQGIVRLGGDDSLPLDDSRYFTVAVRPPWKVLIAAPNSQMRAAGVLAEALAPSPFRRTGQARFDCTIEPIDELLTTPLDEFAAVCLLDPPPLGDDVWQSLHGFVERGGGLAVWLGQNAQAAGRALEDFNSDAAAAVLPGKLKRIWRRQDAFLAPQDYEHPALAKFRSMAGGIPWDAFTVWSHWQLGDLAEGVNTIIPFSNGKAALLERPVGKGRVLTFTTPVTESAVDPDLWNALVVGSQPWPFLMLTNESLLYLVGSGQERLNYLAGDAVTIDIPEDQQQFVFSLRTPDGENYPQAVDQKTGTLTVTSTDVVGNYLLRAGGSESGARHGFSVNIPSAATELARLTTEDLLALLGKDRVRLSRGQQEIERDVSLGRTGRELFPPLIVLVAIALGLEHLLANKFYRRDPQSEEPLRNKVAAWMGAAKSGSAASPTAFSADDRKTAAQV